MTVEVKSRFSKMVSTIGAALGHWLGATDPEAKENEKTLSVQELAIEIQDLDYIVGTCNALATLCLLERNRKYDAYKQQVSDGTSEG